MCKSTQLRQMDASYYQLILLIEGLCTCVSISKRFFNDGSAMVEASLCAQLHVVWGNGLGNV